MLQSNPKRTVKEYFAALKSKDQKKLVSLIDPSSGTRLGRAVKTISEILIDRNDEQFVPLIFGDSATKDRITSLSIPEVCALFLFALEKEKSSVGVEVSDPRIIGELREGDDIAHVVYRLDYSAEIPHVDATTAEMTSCVRENGKWYVCITNDTMSQYYQMINSAMEKSSPPHSTK